MVIMITVGQHSWSHVDGSVCRVKSIGELSSGRMVRYLW